MDLITKIALCIFVLIPIMILLFGMALAAGARKAPEEKKDSNYGDYRDTQRYRDGMEIKNGKPQKVDNSHRGRR